MCSLRKPPAYYQYPTNFYGIRAYKEREQVLKYKLIGVLYLLDKYILKKNLADKQTFCVS